MLGYWDVGIFIKKNFPPPAGGSSFYSNFNQKIQALGQGQGQAKAKGKAKARARASKHN